MLKKSRLYEAYLVVMHRIAYMHAASMLSNSLMFCKFQNSFENCIYSHAEVQTRYRHIWKDVDALIIQNVGGEFGRGQGGYNAPCGKEKPRSIEVTIRCRKNLLEFRPPNANSRVPPHSWRVSRTRCISPLASAHSSFSRVAKRIDVAFRLNLSVLYCTSVMMTEIRSCHKFDYTVRTNWTRVWRIRRCMVCSQTRVGHL